MMAAVEAELSRVFRVSGRRRLFGGASDLHLRHGEGWTDLLRCSTRSLEQDLKRAPREVTVRTL